MNARQAVVKRRFPLLLLAAGAAPAAAPAVANAPASSLQPSIGDSAASGKNHSAADQALPDVHVAQHLRWTSSGGRPLIDVLNERFLRGRPSDSFETAGVVIHQFDDSGFDTSSRRLREGGVSSWLPWMPCPTGQWCSKFGDRFSTSVLNARAPYAFNEYNGGIVINAHTARRSIMCSWATDARSFRAARTCLPNGTRFQWGNGKQTFERREGCVPGCVNGVANQQEDWDTVMHDQLSPDWCDVDGADSWCPWKPHHLSKMMAQQERGFLNTDCAQNNGCRYNEVVLNSSSWVHDLPYTVEGFFYLKGSDPNGVATAGARAAHYAFLKTYDITDAQVPFFELDLQRVNSAGPFKEIRNRLLRDTKYAAQS